MNRRVFVSRAAVLGVGMSMAGLGGPFAIATPSMEAALEIPEPIKSWAKGRVLRQGRVQLALPPLVENGFLVRMLVRVDSPMTRSDHIQEIRIFSEANPSPYVANFHLSPQLPEARVETRIRLADTQSVWAVAQTNTNELWYGHQQVIVTLAACAG
jgi:sulfur-oxidizing protein SoxY